MYVALSEHFALHPKADDLLAAFLGYGAESAPSSTSGRPARPAASRSHGSPEAMIRDLMSMGMKPGGKKKRTFNDCPINIPNLAGLKIA
jgi:hypothetical protein